MLKKEIKRIGLNIPMNIYREIEEAVKMDGITVKAYFLSLHSAERRRRVGELGPNAELFFVGKAEK